MIQFQHSVVKFHCFIVRSPIPDKNQVPKTDSTKDFNPKLLKRMKKDIKHQCNLNDQIKKKVNKNVPRLVIGPVRVVFIMFDPFIQRFRHLRFFSFSESGMVKFFQRRKDLRTINQKREKNHDQVGWKAGFFDEFDDLTF